MSDEDSKIPIDTALRRLLVIEKDRPLSLHYIFNSLSGRGYACWFIFLGFIFCLPINLSALKLTCGLILAFLGLRYAFAKQLWWPKVILERRVLYPTLESFVLKALVVLEAIQNFIHPRLVFFSRHHLMRSLNGILVTLLALILAFDPRTISTSIPAFPILCIGLGLLEDDGLMLLIGYFFALLCFMIFLGIIFA